MENNRICFYFLHKSVFYKTVYDERGNAVRIDIGHWYITMQWYDTFTDSYSDVVGAEEGTVFNEARDAIERCNTLNKQLEENIDNQIKEYNE